MKRSDAHAAAFATRRDALVLRLRALRALDRVDAVVIDPCVRYTDELMNQPGSGRNEFERISDHCWPDRVRRILIHCNLD